MSKFFRFLTRRRKSKRGADNVDSTMKIRAKDSDLECVILHLDNTDFTFYLDKKSTGQTLEEYTFQQIDIADDKNYFGLQYTDGKNIKHWLDISKQVRKQLEIGPPFALQFRVKFFSSDPCNQLRDEYTRYLFVLQLKQLILDGELIVEDIDVAAELAALSLQGELGDYDERQHDAMFISQYRFLPPEQQTEEFELKIIEKYRLLRNRNILPSMADRQYLEKCRALPDYGVDRHYIKGKNNRDYTLGLTPSGILIYEGDAKIGLFKWSQVTKLSFKKSRFKIVAREDEDENNNTEHTFVFQSIDVVACKQMWKSCVEHHAFFRLEGAHRPPTKIQQLFRLKSRFYASFHTEYQMALKSTFGSSMRRGHRSSSFQRVKSQRGAPRESFLANEAERKKIQQKYRDQVREENKAAALLQMQNKSRGKQQGDVLTQSSNESSPTTNNKAPVMVTPTKRNLVNNLHYDSSKSPSNQQSVPTKPMRTQQKVYAPQQSVESYDNNSSLTSGSYNADFHQSDSNNNKAKSKATKPLPNQMSRRSVDSNDQTDSSIDSPRIKPSSPSKSSTPLNRPGYAPIPPKRTIKPSKRSHALPEPSNPDKVILV